MGDTPSELDPFNDGIESKGKYYAMVVLTNKKLLLDVSFSDLTIKVGGDTVYAHAPIVASRCEEILPLPTDEKSRKKKKHEVKVKNVASGAIMSRVLEFVYTGMVDFPKLIDKDILHLNAAARHFKLARLSYLCERWLREHMTIESVFHLLKEATDQNETRVKGFCMQFALQHYNDFISNKDGIYILGIELFQEVVAAFQTNPPAPEEIPPDKAPQDTLLEDFKRMYNLMPFSDITFTIEGEQIKCHKAILAAHSDAFVTYLFKEGGAQQEKITATAFKSMLKFLYYGDDNIDPLYACELVEFSRRYKLHSLLRICEDKIRTNVTMDTVLEIINVASMPAEPGKEDLTAELKNKAYPFLLEHLTEIDLTPLRMYNPLICIEILQRLQDAWKTGKYGYGPECGAGAVKAPPRESKKESHSHSHKSEAEPPASFALGAQRTAGRPAPPPRDGRAPSNLPPPNLSGSGAGAPTPPPRDKPKDSTSNLPPPSVGVPSGMSPRAAAESDSDSELARTNSSKNLGKGGKTSKKDEEKRKKEEAKRLAKEKKERAKMEKKIKGGKGKDALY